MKPLNGTSQKPHLERERGSQWTFLRTIDIIEKSQETFTFYILSIWQILFFFTQTRAFCLMTNGRFQSKFLLEGGGISKLVLCVKWSNSSVNANEMSTLFSYLKPSLIGQIAQTKDLHIGQHICEYLQTKREDGVKWKKKLFYI